MILLALVLLPFINIIYYEYRVIKNVGKNPIDITNAYGIVVMRKKYIK